MFTEILSDTAGQAALSRFATANTWPAAQTFSVSATFSAGLTSTGLLQSTSSSTTVGGVLSRANGTISANPAGIANTAFQAIGAEAVVGYSIFDAAASNAQVLLRRRNGTYASQTAIASGNNLGSVAWQGFGASTFGTVPAAEIRAVALQAFTEAARGTALEFYTTLSGTITQQLTFAIEPGLVYSLVALQGTGSATNTAGVIARANGTISANPTGFGGSNTAFHSIGAQAVPTSNMFDSCAGSNQIVMRRRNGTYSAQTAIANNDVIGQIDVSGFDTVTFRQNAQIQMFAVETFTSTANGTAMSFATTPAGTTTLTTRLTLNTTANFTVPVISGGNYVRVTTAQSPATSAAAGTTGDIAWDDTYLYVRMSTGWRRIALGAAF